MFLLPKIKVFGIGSAGCLIVDQMQKKQYHSVEYYAVDDDYNTLKISNCENKLHIVGGTHSGADYDYSARVTLNSKNIIVDAIGVADIVVLVAGMGGGMGSAATPIIADAAREKGICTVAIVFTPFAFEGAKRLANTERGLSELRRKANTTLVISCEKMKACIPKDAPVSDAMKLANEMAISAMDTIIAPITMPFLINPDYVDMRWVLKQSMNTYFGTGIGKGKDKVVEAVKNAMNCPTASTTIDDIAKLILYVEGGDDLTLDDIQEAVTYLRTVIDYPIDALYAVNADSKLTGEWKVSILATKKEESGEIA